VRHLLVAIALSLAVGPAFAADKAEKREPSEKQKAQQERMKECNAKATDKKGDDRKKFMSACLKGEAPGKQSAQQEKMKTCNQQASSKSLKGIDRKQFMSSCLKGS
jgi:hypothetical protein